MLLEINLAQVEARINEKNHSITERATDSPLETALIPPILRLPSLFVLNETHRV